MPHETNCPKCTAPFKNGMCPSCGFNPDAPLTLGKSETDLNDERETRRLRHRLGLVPQPQTTNTDATGAATAAPASTAAADDTEHLVGYVIGMGYTEDGARAIVAKNADAVRMSLQKARTADAPTSAQALPTLTPPDVSKGW